MRKRLASARASAGREMYQRQIARPVPSGAARPAVPGVDATDRETARPAISGVDKLVYNLYGLTEEEIKIVEASQQ